MRNTGPPEFRLSEVRVGPKDQDTNFGRVINSGSAGTFGMPVYFGSPGGSGGSHSDWATVAGRKGDKQTCAQVW